MTRAMSFCVSIAMSVIAVNSFAEDEVEEQVQIPPAQARFMEVACKRVVKIFMRPLGGRN